MATPCYIAEAWGQEASWGDQSRDRVPYILRGPVSRDIAREMLGTYAAAVAPNGRYLRNYEVHEIGPGIWHGEAEYTTIPPPSTTEWNFEFDTSAENQHIQHSLKTIGKWTKDSQGVPDKGDQDQAIGVEDGKVAGCDIFTPTFTWTEQHQMLASIVTFGYAQTLRDLTGTTNDATFRGFTKGHVLFLGAQARRSSKDPKWVDASFKFRAGRDWIGDIGDIKDVSKLAWEYLWLYYSRAEGTADMPIVQKAKAAYVEQVYKAGDFSLLLIGTGAP